jgi:hypothetical protein
LDNRKLFFCQLNSRSHAAAAVRELRQIRRAGTSRCAVVFAELAKLHDPSAVPYGAGCGSVREPAQLERVAERAGLESLFGALAIARQASRASSLSKIV